MLDLFFLSSCSINLRHSEPLGTKWRPVLSVFEASEEDLNLVLNGSRFLCVIVDSGCALVNYHPIEILSSYSNCLVDSKYCGSVCGLLMNWLQLCSSFAVSKFLLTGLDKVLNEWFLSKAITLFPLYSIGDINLALTLLNRSMAVNIMLNTCFFKLASAIWLTKVSSLAHNRPSFFSTMTDDCWRKATRFWKLQLFWYTRPPHVEK